MVDLTHLPIIEADGPLEDVVEVATVGMGYSGNKINMFPDVNVYGMAESLDGNGLALVFKEGLSSDPILIDGCYIVIYDIKPSH